jgi:adenine-specific DNA methylase
MRGEEELIPAVMRLRAAAPQAWEEFVLVIRRLAAIKAAELVRAPTETIHQMQGQARAFEDIAQMLVEAPRKAQRGEELRDGKRAAAQSGPPNPITSGH